MPAIECAESELRRLSKLVTPSIVSVNTYNSSNYKLDFATGFIVYSDANKTLICVHSSAVKGKGALYVHFSNGDTEKAKIFLRKTPSGHVVLKTGGPKRKAVSFRKNAAKREEIFIIAEAEGGYSGFNFMTGTVGCPNCKAMDEESGAIIQGTEDIFVVTCAAVKWPHQMGTEKELIGAAVFDVIRGAVIGTIRSLDEDAHDLKFCSKSHGWVSKLETLLKAKAKDKTLKLRTVTLRSRGQRNRNRTPEIGRVCGHLLQKEEFL